MSDFLFNGPCPRCGSKDNLANYADGSKWCWGCHYREPRTTSPYVLGKGKDVSSDVSENPRMPEDASTQFSAGAVEWLAGFHLDIPTAISRGVVYSESRDQIIYQLGNVWQARNLREGGSQGNSKRRFSKNFTSGNVNECTHIYGALEVNRGRLVQLVIVEDPVSAIRVAALQDAMPLLGSHLATSRLNSVAGLYNSVVLWLDSDKLKEARDIAGRFKLVGVTARVVWTELDPKVYTNEEIMEILNG